MKHLFICVFIFGCCWMSLSLSLCVCVCVYFHFIFAMDDATTTCLFICLLDGNVQYSSSRVVVVSQIPFVCLIACLVCSCAIITIFRITLLRTASIASPFCINFIIIVSFIIIAIMWFKDI